MPRVERDAEVTLVVLVYRSLRWLEWCMDGVDATINETRYRWCVVANDGTDEVRLSPRVTVDWQNIDPGEHYIARVYRAWNEGVLNSPTQLCILLNSDMMATDHAIDQLVWCKRTKPRSLPCGLLVENGRINSGMPEHVRDFGTNPDNFQRDAFVKYADSIRRTYETEPGRLFQPVLFDRQEFADMGGYPHGNIGSTSGDRILFDRYVAAGYEWVTCKGSVWYHAQEGETRWPQRRTHEPA
jgi:hypothetical protein